MPDDDSTRDWQAMTATEVAELVERDPVIVLPLAATEQHGPHLPLSTDADIGRGLLAHALSRLPSDFPVRVLPELRLGASTEHAHAGMAGTLDLDSEQLAAVVARIGAALAASGVRRLVLSNSHGGNRHAMETAGLRLRRERGLLVVKATYFNFDRPAGVALPDPEWRHGLHGGAVETAMMLHLHPRRVRTGQIRRFESLGEDLERSGSRILPEGPAAFAWLAGDLNRAGVAGDATLATAAIGRELVEHYGDALAAVIRDARTFPLDRLV